MIFWPKFTGPLFGLSDRQHPRDLFDVRDLLRNEGISDDLRRAFIVYLISHHRTMAELLAPTRKPLDVEFVLGLLPPEAPELDRPHDVNSSASESPIGAAIDAVDR